MTSQRPMIESALQKLDLSQVAGAALLGVAPRTMRQWIADQAEMPAPARRLLLLLASRPELADVVEEIAEKALDS